MSRKREVMRDHCLNTGDETRSLKVWILQVSDGFDFYYGLYECLTVSAGAAAASAACRSRAAAEEPAPPAPGCP